MWDWLNQYFRENTWISGTIIMMVTVYGAQRAIQEHLSRLEAKIDQLQRRLEPTDRLEALGNHHTEI